MSSNSTNSATSSSGSKGTDAKSGPHVKIVSDIKTINSTVKPTSKTLTPSINPTKDTIIMPKTSTSSSAPKKQQTKPHPDTQYISRLPTFGSRPPTFTLDSKKTHAFEKKVEAVQASRYRFLHSSRSPSAAHKTSENSTSSDERGKSTSTCTLAQQSGTGTTAPRRKTPAKSRPQSAPRKTGNAAVDNKPIAASQQKPGSSASETAGQSASTVPSVAASGIPKGSSESIFLYQGFQRQQRDLNRLTKALAFIKQMEQNNPDFQQFDLQTPQTADAQPALVPRKPVSGIFSANKDGNSGNGGKPIDMRSIVTKAERFDGLLAASTSENQPENVEIPKMTKIPSSAPPTRLNLGDTWFSDINTPSYQPIFATSLPDTTSAPSATQTNSTATSLYTASLFHSDAPLDSDLVHAGQSTYHPRTHAVTVKPPQTSVAALKHPLQQPHDTNISQNTQNTPYTHLNSLPRDGRQRPSSAATSKPNTTSNLSASELPAAVNKTAKVTPTLPALPGSTNARQDTTSNASSKIQTSARQARAAQPPDAKPAISRQPSQADRQGARKRERSASRRRRGYLEPTSSSIHRKEAICGIPADGKSGKDDIPEKGDAASAPADEGQSPQTPMKRPFYPPSGSPSALFTPIGYYRKSIAHPYHTPSSASSSLSPAQFLQRFSPLMQYNKMRKRNAIIDMHDDSYFVAKNPPSPSTITSKPRLKALTRQIEYDLCNEIPLYIAQQAQLKATMLELENFYFKYMWPCISYDIPKFGIKDGKSYLKPKDQEKMQLSGKMVSLDNLIPKDANQYSLPSTHISSNAPENTPENFPENPNASHVVAPNGEYITISSLAKRIKPFQPEPSPSSEVLFGNADRAFPFADTLNVIYSHDAGESSLRNTALSGNMGSLSPVGGELTSGMILGQSKRPFPYPLIVDGYDFSYLVPGFVYQPPEKSSKFRKLRKSRQKSGNDDDSNISPVLTLEEAGILIEDQPYGHSGQSQDSSDAHLDGKKTSVHVLEKNYEKTHKSEDKNEEQSLLFSDLVTEQSPAKDNAHNSDTLSLALDSVAAGSETPSSPGNTVDGEDAQRASPDVNRPVQRPRTWLDKTRMTTIRECKAFLRFLLSCIPVIRQKYHDIIASQEQCRQVCVDEKRQVKLKIVQLAKEIEYMRTTGKIPSEAQESSTTNIETPSDSENNKNVTTTASSTISATKPEAESNACSSPTLDAQGSSIDASHAEDSVGAESAMQHQDVAAAPTATTSPAGHGSDAAQDDVKASMDMKPSPRDVNSHTNAGVDARDDLVAKLSAQMTVPSQDEITSAVKAQKNISQSDSENRENPIGSDPQNLSASTDKAPAASTAVQPSLHAVDVAGEETMDTLTAEEESMFGYDAQLRKLWIYVKKLQFRRRNQHYAHQNERRQTEYLHEMTIKYMYDQHEARMKQTTEEYEKKISDLKQKSELQLMDYKHQSEKHNQDLLHTIEQRDARILDRLYDDVVGKKTEQEKAIRILHEQEQYLMNQVFDIECKIDMKRREFLSQMSVLEDTRRDIAFASQQLIQEETTLIAEQHEEQHLYNTVSQHVRDLVWRNTVLETSIKQNKGHILRVEQAMQESLALISAERERMETMVKDLCNVALFSGSNSN